MALSLDQELTLFSILNVPYSDSVTIPDDKFNLSSHEYVTANVGQRLQYRILLRLQEIANNIPLEDKLKSYLSEWDEIATATVTLSGSIGNLQGIDYDPTQRLDRIASRIKIIVPVAQFHEEMTNDAINNSISIMGIR